MWLGSQKMGNVGKTPFRSMGICHWGICGKWFCRWCKTPDVSPQSLMPHCTNVPGRQSRFEVGIHRVLNQHGNITPFNVSAISCTAKALAGYGRQSRAYPPHTSMLVACFSVALGRHIHACPFSPASSIWAGLPISFETARLWAWFPHPSSENFYAVGSELSGRSHHLFFCSALQGPHHQRRLSSIPGKY